MTVLPEPYQLRQLGAQVGKVDLSFDDGPDPAATPKILDILKKKNAPATFFLIGSQAQKYSGLARRIYDEGHIIGNHTFTHPNISELSNRVLQVDLNFTQPFFAPKLALQPRSFPP